MRKLTFNSVENQLRKALPEEAYELYNSQLQRLYKENKELTKKFYSSPINDSDDATTSQGNNIKKSLQILLYDLFNSEVRLHHPIIEYMKNSNGQYTESDDGKILKSKNFIATLDRYIGNFQIYNFTVTIGDGDENPSYTIKEPVDYDNLYESISEVYENNDIEDLENLAIDYLTWLYYADRGITPDYFFKSMPVWYFSSFNYLLSGFSTLKSFLSDIMDEEGIPYNKLSPEVFIKNEIF